MRRMSGAYPATLAAVALKLASSRQSVIGMMYRDLELVTSEFNA